MYNVRLNIIDGKYTLWVDGEIVKQEKGEQEKGDLLDTAFSRVNADER